MLLKGKGEGFYILSLLMLLLVDDDVVHALHLNVDEPIYTALSVSSVRLRFMVRFIVFDATIGKGFNSTFSCAVRGELSVPRILYMKLTGGFSETSIFLDVAHREELRAFDGLQESRDFGFLDVAVRGVGGGVGVKDDGGGVAHGVPPWVLVSIIDENVEADCIQHIEIVQFDENMTSAFFGMTHEEVEPCLCPLEIVV